jgi:hypothetical protein
MVTAAKRRYLVVRFPATAVGTAEKVPPCVRVVRQKRESGRKEHWFSLFASRFLPSFPQSVS